MPTKQRWEETSELPRGGVEGPVGAYFPLKTAHKGSWLPVQLPSQKNDHPPLSLPPMPCPLGGTDLGGKGFEIPSTLCLHYSL